MPYHTWYTGRPNAWRHDGVQFKHIGMFAGIAYKANQNRPMANIFVKNDDD